MDVQVAVDARTCQGQNTRAMTACCQELADAGVHVTMVKGYETKSTYQSHGRECRPGYGIQHSKTLVVDEYLVLGSTNWTVSSCCNREMSALILLNEQGMIEVDRWRKDQLRDAETFTSILGAQLLQGRVDRALRSTSQDRYSTARRFSIARSRAKSVDASSRHAGS